MGTWKTKQARKKNKRSFTASNRAKIYIAIPPPEGWPGGVDYYKNGMRNGKR